MEPNQSNGADDPETAPTLGGTSSVSMSPRRTVKDAIAISLDDVATEAEEPGVSVTTGNQEPPEPAVRPGAVSVSSAAPRGKRRPTSTVDVSKGDSDVNGTTEAAKHTVAAGNRNTRPSRNAAGRSDAKTALREEMDSLRKSNGPSKPGAVSVSASSTSEPRSTTVSDPKASIKREMAALRSTGPSQPGAVSVPAQQGSPTPNDPKASIKREMAALRSSGPSQPGAVPVSSQQVSSTDAKDPKAAIKREMSALRSNGPSKPGAVPVSTQQVSSTSKDPKAAIKREMDSLRSSGQPSRPGAMSVSSSGAAPSSNADPKARIKAEMNSLRQSGEPIVAPALTSSVLASDSDTRPSDSKERIKAEMNALRSGGPSTPGAVSMSATEAEADSRTSRAARKARGRSAAEPSPQTSASSKAAPAGSAGVPGAVSGTPDDVPESERSKAPRMPAGRTVDAARAKAEADKLMDYDRHKPKPAPEAGPAEVAGATAATATAARAQAESNKSIETAQSSNSMFSIDPSKTMGLEEMARQKKEAEAAHAEQPPPQAAGGAIDNGEEIVSAVVVDEDALEAEYQQRLMENVVSAEVVDQKEVDARNRRRCICRCCCPLILVAIILSLVIPLTGRDPEVITNPPTGAPTPISEYDYLVDILEPISGDNLFLEGSPQYQAFDWLLNDDPAELDIKAANVSTLIHRYVLATFYYSTGGPNWNQDFGFLSNRSICEWNIQRQGCVCFDDSEEPLSLFFNGIDMNGTLPAEMTALSTLTLVSLVNDAGLAGTIPTEIGAMTSLTLLQLFRTGMSGTIPESVGALKNVEVLVFSTNAFTGTIPDIFSDPGAAHATVFLQNNDLEGTLTPFRPQSELSWFLVSGNARLTGTLPSSIYSQLQLEWVAFRDTGIGGKLDPKISALTDMAFWQADRAAFSGTIPTSIGGCDLMEQFLLGDNALTGSIPSQFSRLDRMTTLNLSGNDLAGTIPSELVGMRDLEVLQLNGNIKLTGSVPANFAQELRELKEFNLEGTNITSGLAESYCALDVMTTVISADCGGEDPFIPCDCCVECCEGGEDCVFALSQACNVRSGALVDEDRGATCQCEPNGTNYTCQETCQVCSLDGTTCAQSMGYGHILDAETGDNSIFFNVFEYTLGGWDDIIEFRNDVAGSGSCEVFVNGLECDTCTESTCENGFNGYSIDCTNLEPELSFRSCFPDVGEPNSLDIFKYIDAGFVNDTACLPLFPF